MQRSASFLGQKPGTGAPPNVQAGNSTRFGRIGVVLLVLFSLVLVSGCVRYGEEADLVIVNGPEPESLDPAMVTAVGDLRIVNALFEGLTRYDPVTVKPIPGLAERWEISNQGRTYTFFLRSNLVWSTGEPITVHDVVYSWMRVLDPASGCKYSGQLHYVKNAADYNTGKTTDPSQVAIKALDDHTLEVELNEPTPFFLDLCAFATLAVVPRHAIEKHGDRWIMAHPVPVSGAFELVYWRMNDRIRLKRNHRYWDAENTKSEVIDLYSCTSAATALNLYESGAVDVVWDRELAPPALLDILRQRPDFHIFDYLGTYFFRFNVTRPPFDDARVRKALALAIDKRRIVERITRMGEKPVSHLVPQGIPGYEPPEGLGYDPELGRRLLAEAGFPEGRGFPRVQYLYNTQATHEKIAVELQEMWRRELGINIELRSMEFKVFLPAQSNLEYDMSRSSWFGDYNDPNTFLDLFLSSNPNNRTGWKHDGYDELIQIANAEPDATKRAELLRQAEIILVREEVPIVPLFIYVGLQYFDPDKIKGIHHNLLGEHPFRAIHKVGQASRLPKPEPGSHHTARRHPRSQTEN